MRTNRNNTEVYKIVRRGFREDLGHIRNRIERLSTGTMPFVDVDTADAFRIMHKLRAITEEIERAILPSDT
jgi:hypothetical protein